MARSDSTDLKALISVLICCVRLAKSRGDWHKSLQKFSIMDASLSLTPQRSAWPYLVGLDMEIDSRLLENVEIFLSIWHALKRVQKMCSILFLFFFL